MKVRQEARLLNMAFTEWLLPPAIILWPPRAEVGQRRRESLWSTAVEWLESEARRDPKHRGVVGPRAECGLAAVHQV